MKSLESEIAKKEALHAKRIKTLSTEYENQLKDLRDKIEAMEVDFTQEKAKIEQSLQDQLEAFHKFQVEAHAKQAASANEIRQLKEIIELHQIRQLKEMHELQE